MKPNKKPARRKWQNGLLFNPEDRHSTFLLKHTWTSTKVHGITSQKIVIFVAAAVRTLNPT
jgi:hypothetical protein